MAITDEEIKNLITDSHFVRNQIIKIKELLLEAKMSSEISDALKHTLDAEQGTLDQEREMLKLLGRG